MPPFVTHSEKETIELGKEFARRFKKGDVIALYGDLGTGKTRLIQGICAGLGVREHVASPTFTLINEYPVGEWTIYHFDFYRIQSQSEIVDIGFEEYLIRDGICLIEWAEKAAGLLPPKRYDVQLSLGDDDQAREIRIEEIVEVAA